MYYGKHRQHQTIQMEQGVFASTERERHTFFYPVKRTESTISFEYRITDGGELQTLIAFVFVPAGHNYEVAGPIEWNRGKVFLEANRCIKRGGKGRRNENGDHEVLIGEKWVKTENMLDAINAMDESFLNCLEKRVNRKKS